MYGYMIQKFKIDKLSSDLLCQLRIPKKLELTSVHLKMQVLISSMQSNEKAKRSLLSNFRSLTNTKYLDYSIV